MLQALAASPAFGVAAPQVGDRGAPVVLHPVPDDLDRVHLGLGLRQSEGVQVGSLGLGPGYGAPCRLPRRHDLADLSTCH